MSLNITADQYRTTLQSIQNRYIKIELLNYQYQTVEELSGICTGGNLTIDASADIRRTGNIQLVITDKTFEVESGGKIWLDKYVKIWVGTKNIATNQIEYVNCGLYIIDAPSYSYNSSTNTLSLSLLDLMAKLTGGRNGYVQGSPVLLKSGENIRTAIIKTLERAGFSKYVVEEAPTPSVIPNDMKFELGTTYYEILSGLRDIYPNYEIFFDVNGTFFYKPIPTGKDDPVLIKDDIWNNIYLNENFTTDFQNVKNSIEVFGRTHKPSYLASKNAVTIDKSNIRLLLAQVQKYSEEVVYAFEVENIEDILNAQLQINDLGYVSILNDKEEAVNIKKEKENTVLCVQYITQYQLTVDSKVVITSNGLTDFLNAVNSKYNKEYTNTAQIKEGTVSESKHFWRWLGHLQAHGLAEDLNEKSPFYVNGTVGKIYLPLYDGVYANCITDNLAQERAEFELYQHTNMKNTVVLSCVPVYWFDVNILTEYTSKRYNKKEQYLIKNISMGLAPNDEMTITMIRYYPESPFIIKE